MNVISERSHICILCSLEISTKEMNVGAERLGAILAEAAKDGRELNIWRQFGERISGLLCDLLACEVDLYCNH